MTRDEIIECMARGMVDGEANRLVFRMSERALTALEAAGMAVVPVESTEKMVRAGFESGAFDNDTFLSPRRRLGDIYRAMLAAAKE